MAVEKQARLDKEHGFLKQIIKNQIDRDEYDKEVKAQRVKQRRERIQHLKRPDQNIYSPPKKNSQVEGQSEENHQQREELLAIEFVNQNEEVMKHMMYKGEHPRQVASFIGRKQGLQPLFIQALAETIIEELNRMKSGT